MSRLLAALPHVAAARRQLGSHAHEAPPRRVTVARGDGIGPEIMDATLRILEAAKAGIAPEFIEIGEQVYKRGVSAGIEPSGWKSLRETRLFLKAPITTPLGGGVKSLNVTVRKTLGLFANVRPVMALAPFVATHHPEMDVVIVRENEEDLYAGIEHRHTSEVLQCLKLITLPGCERIVRYAFDYARQFGRRKVTCMSKDNIMKLTDGAFHGIFERIARDEYPDIAADHRIIDIGAAQLAAKPGQFDVIVTLNLYGDIISDIAAEVSGSIGMAGSANIGDHSAMFEAVHGSAPDIAGRDVANPSGLLNAAISMLVHIGQQPVAATIKNAWLKTIEDGMHTADIYRRRGDNNTMLVGTRAFTDAVIARLGQQPSVLRAAARVHPNWPNAATKPKASLPQMPVLPRAPVKTLVGVDIFVDWDQNERDPEVLASSLQRALAELQPPQQATPALRLVMISNRGVKVWPDGFPETYKVNHWRCRFEACLSDSSVLEPLAIAQLLAALSHAKLEVVKTENLFLFDGEPGYSLGQGQ